VGGRLLIVGDGSWPLSSELIALDLYAQNPCNLHSVSGALRAHTEEEGWVEVAGVIWRGQFDADFRREHDLLTLLAVAGVPCVNSVSAILSAGVRASGNDRLARAGLPVVDAQYFWGRAGINYFFEPNLPTVVKVGNWQQGYGKARAITIDQWRDVLDLAVTHDELLCVEPFLAVSRDLRCLTVYEKTIAIERVGRYWKANVDPLDVRLVDIPDAIRDLQIEAARCIGADVVGIDWVQLADGSWTILETNMAPGLAGRGLFDLRPLVLERFRNEHRINV
jgi:ribosomal protein S6--L-glutamate ligase